MHLRPGGRIGPRIAPCQLLVDGERRFAIRRIQLRFPPQPQVSIAGPQQGQGRVLARRELVRDLAELVGRLRSEEHTSELQSHSDLVCRLLLEKKKKNKKKEAE